MKNDGWDVSKDLKWGYFFFDKNRENLIKLFELIKDRNYTVESLHQNDSDYWVLYISKIETHTPESLHNRNMAMNELAEFLNVELYDGWEVEPI